jgi:hypothetical protein
MTWRKWLVRSLVFSVLGLALAAVLLYQAWTNPNAVRQLVRDELGKLFVGATVSVDSARLRLFGGIAVRDVRMARREELDRGDWLYVPSAVIYHDKEHLLHGELGVRKIEMDRLRMRIVRERDGRLNVAGLLAPPDLKDHVPTLIIRQGIVQIEDRSVAGPPVVLEIKEVNLSVVNDPLSTLVIEGGGQSDALGAVKIRAKLHRPSGAASAVVELPHVSVGAALVRRMAGYCPDANQHLRELKGEGKIETTLAYRSDAAEPWSYDVRVELNEGQWQPDCLPSPLHHLHAELRCINGRIPHARLRARCDTGTVALDVWDLVWPGHRPKNIEDIVAKLEAKVEHVTLTSDFLEHLPPLGAKIQKTYNPAGPVSLSYTYQRGQAGHWEKHWRIQPEGMTAEFEHFRYPLEYITGTIEVDLAGDREDFIRVDLNGRGGGRPLSVHGSIRGDKASEVDILVAADDVPIDRALIAALPPRSRDTARTFLPAKSRELGLAEETLGLTRPAGLADIKVYVRRERGRDNFSNRYLISFHDTALKYDIFPYPLEKVTGVLDIQPDHWECRDFHGSHKGGEIYVNACSYRVDAGSEADKETRRQGDRETGRRRDRETGRQGDGETGRQGDRETGRQGDKENRASYSLSLSPCLPVSLSAPGPQHECVQIYIRGKDILLDPEFEQALSPPELPSRAALHNAWAMLALRGRLSFESVVVDRPDQPQDIDVTVEVKGCSMQPDFFRYPMNDVSARVRYKQGRVYVQDVRAKHGACRLGMKDGLVDLKPGGGFTAWFTDIRGDDLTVDEDFLRALHPAMRRGLEPLQIRKPLNVLASELTLDAAGVPGEPLKIWWKGGATLRKQLFQAGLDIDEVDGVVWCEGHHNGRQFEGVSGHALLERAVILGQPFTKLHGRIKVAPETPDILSLYDMKAKLFDGDIVGEARFTFNSPMRYEVKLDAMNVLLEQFGKHNRLGPEARLQGPASASVFLTGEGTDLSGLRGNGRFDLARGKLYRLPLLLDLLKAFSLRLPDRTAFEQAQMIFGIEGPQMRVHSLDLYGNAISLRGQGTLNLDGSNLNLDFSADWGRLSQILPSGISALPQAVSDQLFKIKLRGKINAPRFEKEFLPPVVEPIKRVFRGS